MLAFEVISVFFIGVIVGAFIGYGIDTLIEHVKK